MSLVRDAQDWEGYDRCDVTAPTSARTEPGGVVARLTFRRSITSTGFDLMDPWARLLAMWNTNQGGRVTKALPEVFDEER